MSFFLSGLPGSGGFFVNMYEIGGQFTGIIIGLVNTQYYFYGGKLQNSALFLSWDIYIFIDLVSRLI